MQTVRQKWQQYKTYQRLQRLWEEYLLASNREEFHAMAIQLDEFLGAFQEAYNEQVQVLLPTHVNTRLDKIYGDCSEILVNLLYTIERIVNHRHKNTVLVNQATFYRELINKGLDVSKLILQEERYRRVVLDTPNLTTRLLVLLNKLKHTDTKQRALRVLLALGQEDDAKLEIGRQQGFRKIFRLISAEDNALITEIIHTIKRLTETQSEARMRLSMTVGMEDNRDDNQSSHFGSLLGGTVGDKVTSLVSDVRDIMSFELGRVLNHLSSPANSTRGRVDYFHNNPAATEHKYDFVPSAAMVEHWLTTLQLGSEDGTNDTSHNKMTTTITTATGHNNDNYRMMVSDTKDNYAIAATSTMNIITAESQSLFGRWRSLIGLGKGKSMDTEPIHAEHRVPEESYARMPIEGINEPTENAKAVRNFLRQQGAIRSLTEILQRCTTLNSTSRLELVEILCKLLFDHPESQLAFKQLDGYTSILQDLHRPWEPELTLPDNDNHKQDDEDEDTSQEENTESKEDIWYQDYFNLLFTISLGLNSNLKVTNLDAFNLLFRIAGESNQLTARRHAIYCIQDLITINPFNAVVGWKDGGIDRLLQMLMSLVTVDGDHDILAKQMGLDDEVVYNAIVNPVSIDDTSRRATALEKIVDRSVLWQYIALLTGLLEYFSVLLCDHNLYILNEYTRILMQASLPSHNVVAGIILRSVGRLLTDQLGRQNSIESKFLNIYLQLLRRSYHMTDSILDTDENPNVAELPEHSMTINLRHLVTIDPIQRVMVQEQYLSLLQIVGMLIEITGRDMELLKVDQGFQILHDIVALSTVICWKAHQTDPNLPIEVEYDVDHERLICDMAMWLLRECLLCQDATSDGIKWLVKLLKLVLTNLISPVQVPWTIREDELADANGKQKMLNGKEIGRPFRFAFSWFQVKICQLLSSVFRRSNLAKRHFGELGGIEALLTILSQTRDLEVATCALITVGDLFAGGEETKQLLGETFGYEGFMELVLSSNRPLDRLCCQILLEVATVGNVVRDLSQVGFDEEPFSLSTAVIPFIAGLLAPTVLFETLLPLYDKRKPGFHTPLIQRPASQGKPSSHRATPTASRPSSVFSDGNRRFRDTGSSSLGDHTRGHDSISMFSVRPRSIAGPLMDMRTEALLGDIRADPCGQIPSPRLSPLPESSNTTGCTAGDSIHDSRTTNRSNGIKSSSLDVTSQIDHSIMENEDSLAKRLIGVVFRDRYAAHMAFKLLFRVATGGHELQLYYFKLLVQLLHVNPQNQQLICMDQGLEWIIRSIISEILDNTTTLASASLASLVSLIGSHDIGPSEAALLLNAIYDPLRVATDHTAYSLKHRTNNHHHHYLYCNSTTTIGELQHELLLALLDIATRLDPVYMFSFDGASAHLTFPLDKLPGHKTGYTFSCWLRVTAFLGDDTGFLCYVDAQGCFFELYFRRLTQSNRCCLCVRTQQHPMPPEDFVFYGYDFTNAPGWHHIVLAHSRQDMTLFIDGQLVQTCNTFHYPRASSRDRVCTGVVGRRGYGSAVGEYFCGQLSGMIFFEGLWHESVAKRVFDQGPRFTEQFRTLLNIDHREALSIDPKTCFSDTSTTTTTSTIIANNTTIIGAINTTNSNTNHVTTISGQHSFNATTSSNDHTTSNHSINPNHSTVHITSSNSNNDTMISGTGTASSNNNNNNNTIIPLVNSSNITTTPITSTTNSSVNAAISVLMTHGSNYIDHATSFTRSAGCSVHAMRKLGDVIQQVGGPQVCFPMMETSLEYQLIGLNIIVCLLLKSPENRRQFMASSGFHVIRHLLATSRWPLTMDHFDLLLEIACDGHTEHTHRVLVHWEGMDMYTDMLIHAPENVQLEAIHLLVDVLIDLRKNLTWWRDGLGLAWLFDFLLLLPATQHQFLFRLLDAMMEDLTATELGHLLDFIAYEKRQYLDHKCEVLDLLLRHATWNPHLVELLASANGLTLLISFLDLPSERFRLLVLKLLGVLMSYNVRQSRTIMTKVGGFDAMWLFLAPFPVTSDLVQTLLGVALNFYRCDQPLTNTSNTNGGVSDPLTTASLGVRKPMLRLSLQLTDSLVYPELIRLTLELLRACDNVNLIFDLLADVKRMLTEDNMVTLWEYPWTEWFAVFLQDRGVMEKSNYGRISTMVHAIAQRMMVFDMARRVSVINRLKGAVAENETFQLQLIDDVLAYYERRPGLEVDIAPEVLKNLAILYRHLDEYQPPNAAIYLRFAGCLNQIACHTAAETRNIMKTIGLFNIRDTLIINLLQADLSTLEQMDVFGKFSFEMLADQPRFRESHGLLLLMRAFHLAEPTVRPTIARILLSVFRPSTESRRIMAAIIEDPEVIRRFFTVSLRDRPDEEYTRSSVEDEVDYLDDVGSSNHSYTVNNSVTVSFRSDTGESTLYGEQQQQQQHRLSARTTNTTMPMTLSEFLVWYFQSDPDAILRRSKIEQRIETLYAPVSMVYRRAQERVFTRRHKRMEHIREKHLRHASALNRALADLKAKGKQRMDQGATNHRQRMDTLREARQTRFKAGEESWRLRVHNAGVQSHLMRSTNH